MPHRFAIAFGIVALCGMVALLTAPLYQSTQPPETAPVESLKLKKPRLVIDKKKKRLAVLDGDQEIHQWPIGSGRNPGPKTREGDGCTPEGHYYICVRNTESKHDLSLGLSYPNLEDAKAALADKRITPEHHAAILESLAHKRRPPWNTPLGGEIFIHGGGASKTTGGSISIDAEPMAILFELARLGTPVEIRP